MGIQGLIGFVNAATEQIDIDQLAGKRVAIDSYCWLHKGAFGCAEKLAIGEKTDSYVKYCISLIKMLKASHIIPIMVFDGRHLPAKANEEKSRRETRKNNKAKAAQLLRSGQKDKARRYMASSIDVTHEMALQLIQACRKLGVDSIVAPYEADAQLAYLNINGYVDCVVTEDSDLILFGCHKVLFKLQRTGTALLYDSDKLSLVMQMPEDRYDFKFFRRMCILSGCDYLSSLPGIGLMKAKKFVLQTHDLDFRTAIQKIGQYLKMPKLTVPDDYVDNFLKAEATFLHQFVYDPKRRQMVRLTDASHVDDVDTLSQSGQPIDDNEAFQHALGNIDPFSKKVMDNWNPDNAKLSKYSIWQNVTGKQYSNDSPEVASVFRTIKVLSTCDTNINSSIPEEQTALSNNELKKLYENNNSNDDDNINKRKFSNISDFSSPTNTLKRQNLFPVRTTHQANEQITPSQELVIKLQDLRTDSSFMNNENKKNDLENSLSGNNKTPEKSPSFSCKSPTLNRRYRLRGRFVATTDKSVTTANQTPVMSAFFANNKREDTSAGGQEEKCNSVGIKDCAVVIIKDVPSVIDAEIVIQPTNESMKKTSVRVSGLSKGYKSNKLTKNQPASQTLLSKFGFVKKQQI